MFYSHKLPEKKGQALGLGGGHTCGGGKSVQADLTPLNGDLQRPDLHRCLVLSGYRHRDCRDARHSLSQLPCASTTSPACALCRVFKGVNYPIAMMLFWNRKL